jgi:hypothetical protein
MTFFAGRCTSPAVIALLVRSRSISPVRRRERSRRKLPHRRRRRPPHASPPRRPGGEERLLISERTKSSLAVRKTTGATLGNPINIHEAGAIGRASQTAAADDYARNLLPVLRAVRNEGAITLGCNFERAHRAEDTDGSRCTMARLYRSNPFARVQRLEELQ